MATNKTVEERLVALETEVLNLRVFVMKYKGKIDVLHQAAASPATVQRGEIPGGTEVEGKADQPPTAEPDVAPKSKGKLSHKRRPAAVGEPAAAASADPPATDI